ncbi:hypothetical protein GALL_374140 [mine drainage metagenome]|uniref:DUF2844 domain-containing protein n=1 Tax=mine drainage metagenome TaxID=410659 RepID=A0A1J5QLJ0_9ZZZZ
MPFVLLLKELEMPSKKTIFGLLKAGMVLLVSAWASHVALAALGQPASSVLQDGTMLSRTNATVLKQTRSTDAQAGHELATTAEILTPEGVTVTEYINGKGVVFAIAWHGPVKPNLQRLLGQYFQDYIRAATAKSGSLSAANTTGTDIVVNSAGAMQAFLGMAYVPSLMPSGFSITQIHP